MAHKILTIIIPVRNEEETIHRTIASLEKMVRTPHTILIADDTIDPMDRTIEVLRQDRVAMCKKTKQDEDGFGPALVRAIKTVKTPYTVMVMADLSDDPKTIDRMMRLGTTQSYDVVCGCRYMRGAKKIGGPKAQGILSTLANGILYRCFRFPTRDATNAFKLYNTSFLKSILPKIPETGVEFSLQLITLAVSQNARMVDVPTVWRGREKGVSKVHLFSRGQKYLRLLYKAAVNR
jgi:glycosyltransferase involved in cell wall biosynthesis